MSEELKHAQHDPTIEAFDRILKSLKVWKGIAMVGILLWPILAGVWVVYEEKRAASRWKSDQFEMRVNEYVNRSLDGRGYGMGADQERLARAVSELASEQRELRDTVNKMLGAWEAERRRKNP